MTTLEQRQITDYSSQASLLITTASDLEPPFTTPQLSSLSLDQRFELSSGQQDTGSTFVYSSFPATELVQASSEPAHTSGDEAEPDTGPLSPILELLLIEDEDSYELHLILLIQSTHLIYMYISQPSYNLPVYTPVYNLVKGEILIISLSQWILLTNRSSVLTSQGYRIISSPAG